MVATWFPFDTGNNRRTSFGLRCHWLLLSFPSVLFILFLFWPILDFGLIYFAIGWFPAFYPSVSPQLQWTNSVCKSGVVSDISILSAFSVILIMMILCWIGFFFPPNFQTIFHKSSTIIPSQKLCIKVLIFPLTLFVRHKQNSCWK